MSARATFLSFLSCSFLRIQYKLKSVEGTLVEMRTLVDHHEVCDADEQAKGSGGALFSRRLIVQSALNTTRGMSSKLSSTMPHVL